MFRNASSCLGLFLLITLTASATAFSQTLFTLKDSVSGPDLDALSFIGAAEQFQISVDPSLVASNPETLEFELPDGRRLLADRKSFRAYDTTWMNWNGEVRVSGPSWTVRDRKGFLYLNDHGEYVTGVLNLGHEQYRIIMAEGDQRLVRLSEKRPPSCGMTMSGRDLNPAPRPLYPATPWKAKPAPISRQAELATKATTIIDVLFVYPEDGFPGFWDRWALEHFIRDSVSLANVVFAESGVNAEYRYIIEPLESSDQPQPASVGASLAWLNGKLPGQTLGEAPAEVASLRAEHAADMVALMVPSNWPGSSCGVANIPELPDDPSIVPPEAGWTTYNEGFLFNKRAFSAHKVDCGLNDFTFAHELGHNFGMRHGPFPEVSPEQLFSYALGYTPFDYAGETSRASVMACFNVSVPPVCNRVNRFSDPSLDPSGVSDNARVAREQVQIFAEFYSPSVFDDVPPSHWAVDEIETLYFNGITNGCASNPLRYCPSSDVTRAHMAVFLVRSMYGSDFVPPAPTGIFADVPVSHWAAPWIEQIYNDGITGGCASNPLRYCPDSSLILAHAAVFLTRALHGAGFVPPAPTGIFADVPVSHWAAPWIEQMYHDGITNGCASNPLRFCPDSSLTRDQMAVFLVRAFNLR